MNNDYIVDEPKCTACPLWENSAARGIRRSGVYGRGSGINGLWLYGESLGADEVQMGLPFVGRGGELLNLILKDVGINDKECYLTTSVRCLLPNNQSPKAAQIKKCMETHALVDAPQTPPKLIVTLGNVPLKAVLNLQKITENRGKLFDSELFKCKVLPTFDPNSIIHNPKNYDTLREDLIKAREFILDQEEVPPKVHKELICSKEKFLEWMGLLSSDSIKSVYCDIESNGLEFFKHDIVSMSFTIELEDEYYSIAFLTKQPYWETLPENTNKTTWWYADLDDKEIRDALQFVLRKPIEFHGGLFDVKMLWYKSYYVNQANDTMTKHGLINENVPHNLKYLTSIHNKSSTLEGKEEFNQSDEYEDGEFYKSPPTLLLNINIDDTYNGAILSTKFNKLLEVEQMTGFYNKLAMPVTRSFSRMSYRGIKMDREGIVETSNKYRKKIREKEVELFDLAGQKFEYSKSKDLIAVLFNKLKLPILKRTKKDKLPSTDKDTLDDLSYLHPVPALIKELRSLKGTITKYLDGNDLSAEIDPGLGMLCKLDKNDRIHGPFLVTGTVSGRPSCPKPNLLNIPKNPDIRQLFVAENGWKLIEFDYSQAELVLMAYLSGDPDYINDIKTDDFHLATARGILKQETVDEFGRRNAKSANFLKSYGGGAEKLSKALQAAENKQFEDKFNKKSKVTIKCSSTDSWYHERKGIPLEYLTVNGNRSICYVCEAEKWLKGWDEHYPLVPIYKQQVANEWRERGFIEGLYGRKKRFSIAPTQEVESKYDRQAVNFMCQNGVGDAINSALVDIDSLFDILFGWNPQTLYSIPGIVLTVYDSILIECPDDMVEDIKGGVLEIMSVPLPKLGISLKTDTNVSQRWGEKLKKQDLDIDIEQLIGE